ncbi:MAG: nicotinamide mononucleotide transporter [Clostridia bacterium]|nr:nicotinamide mononucleotide transporter [Clostridia bacterium]
MKKILNYFSTFEKVLWCASVILITASFLAFSKDGYITLAASLVGTTALIFNAKGNPLGPFLCIIFSVLYGIISYSFAYYGELLTYVAMSAPMSAWALISWMRNPHAKGKAEVKVNSVSKKEMILLFALTPIVTVAFYFILNAFGTANIIPSTISVATSFMAVYLTARRSPYFALAYAANDVVLIILWTLAAFKDISYVSVIVCFIIFLINDTYSFISWQKMKKRQH